MNFYFIMTITKNNPRDGTSRIIDTIYIPLYQVVESYAILRLLWRNANNL